MSNTQQHNTHDDAVQYDMSMYFTVHVTFQGWKYCDIVILLYACLLFYSHKKPWFYDYKKPTKSSSSSAIRFHAPFYKTK